MAPIPAYPVPPDEDERLAELEDYDILDAAPEGIYDDLCRVASQICGTSIAAITLIDEDKQWIKAATGMDTGHTAREDAFCAHAIVNPDQVMVVEDALEDERFQANPYVQGDPNIRFYAGSPLKTPEGRGLGTICALDDEPRSGLSDAQRASLEALSQMVMTQLELRRRSQQLRQTKDRFEELTEELRRSNEELDRFASVVSHELKNPLSQLSGYLDLLALAIQDDLSDEEEEYLQRAMHGSDRMEDLIQDLLRYARAGRGGGELQPVNLAGVCEHVLDELSGLIEASEATVEVDADLAVPGDPSMLRHVVQNLVHNAVKYSDHEPTVHIRAHREGGRVRVEVEDHGIGIPEDEQDALFEIFHRCSNTGDRAGSGVGLALAHRIILRHRGTMGVESAVGEGSTFWFTLPASVEEMPAPQA